MNKTTKRVFAKLSKEESVELKAEKVELKDVKTITKLLEGFKKDIASLEKEQDKLNQLFSKYYNAQKEYNKQVPLTEAGYGLVEQAVKEFEEKIRQLGLDPKDQPIIKGAISEIKSLKAMMKPLKQSVKKV